MNDSPKQAAAKSYRLARLGVHYTSTDQAFAGRCAALRPVEGRESEQETTEDREQDKRSGRGTGHGRVQQDGDRKVDEQEVNRESPHSLIGGGCA